MLLIQRPLLTFYLLLAILLLAKFAILCTIIVNTAPRKSPDTGALFSQTPQGDDATAAAPSCPSYSLPPQSTKMVFVVVAVEGCVLLWRNRSLISPPLSCFKLGPINSLLPPPPPPLLPVHSFAPARALVCVLSGQRVLKRTFWGPSSGSVESSPMPTALAYTAYGWTH